jgi:hypothetical protein
MKKITSSILFALCLFSMFAFTISDEWYLYESKTFSFKAEYPGKPAEKVKVLNTAEGDLNLNLIEYVTQKTETESPIAFIASYIEYPIEATNSDDKEKLKQFYRKMVDGVVAKVSGKLMKETIITLEGFEGVEARIEMKDGAEFVKLRVYLIHNKMYMVETVTETKNETNKSINRFINSFRIIK